VLATLDSVDWGALRHAYGAATNIPDLLRRLAVEAPGVEPEESALDELANYINHQGSLYEATPCVVPFLIELAAAGPGHLRYGLLDFLASLGGYGAPEISVPLPAGPAPAPAPEQNADELRAEAREAVRIWQADREQERALARAIYARVREGLESYLPRLSDSEPSVRVAAAQLLALFADAAPTTALRLLTAFAAEADSGARAEILGHLGGLLAVGQAALDAFKLSPYPARLEAALVDPGDAIAFAAAAALAPLLRAETPDRAVALLQGGLVAPERYSVHPRAHDRFHTALRALRHVGPAKALAALLRKLETTPEIPYPHSVLAVVEAVLDLACGAQPAPGWRRSERRAPDGLREVRYASPSLLHRFRDGVTRAIPFAAPAVPPLGSPSPHQRRALRAIAGCEALWGRYRTNLFALFGLPEHRGRLAELAG
jgi:hypothetical protein